MEKKFYKIIVLFFTLSFFRLATAIKFINLTNYIIEFYINDHERVSIAPRESNTYDFHIDPHGGYLHVRWKINEQTQFKYTIFYLEPSADQNLESLVIEEEENSLKFNCLNKVKAETVDGDFVYNKEDHASNPKPTAPLTAESAINQPEQENLEESASEQGGASASLQEDVAVSPTLLALQEIEEATQELNLYNEAAEEPVPFEIAITRTHEQPEQSALSSYEEDKESDGEQNSGRTSSSGTTSTEDTANLELQNLSECFVDRSDSQDSE